MGKVFTLLAAPIMDIVTLAMQTRINALPPGKPAKPSSYWKIPLDAPPLPQPFLPEAISFGLSTIEFDQAFDAPGTYRNPLARHEAGDAYSTVTPSPTDLHTDAARGDESSEAALKYDNRAYLRMEARRDGLVKPGEKVEQESAGATTTAAYKAWRTEKITSYFAESIDTHATDHSTIVTNPMHAEKALAYDVAIGACDIYEEDLQTLRIAADWRFLRGLDQSDPNRCFLKYFESGKYGVDIFEWARTDAEGNMPLKIKNIREWAPMPKVGEP